MWPLPVFVTPPWDREVPEEYSVGTNPTYDPIDLPVNRVQSPTSTANPHPVRALTPRRHPSRSTTTVNSESRAMLMISPSRRSRRPLTDPTAS